MTNFIEILIMLGLLFIPFACGSDNNIGPAASNKQAEQEAIEAQRRQDIIDALAFNPFSSKSPAASYRGPRTTS